MPHRWDLVTMASHVRSGKLTPPELVEAHLRQIQRHNPALNAFHELYADEARAQAQHPLPGPLSGVPVTIKECFDVAGKATPCGSLLRLNEIAATDSTAAHRLRSAGAILIGKTSNPEFLANWETDNRLTGRVNNPWNLERTPGGSSGGESAAIASFMSPGGVGSDGGGSIRVPAHFTGICGLKPTPGRVSIHGHWPEITHPIGFIGAAGPMARTAADVRLLFQVLAGHDPRDHFSVPIPIDPSPPPPSRIAVMEQYGSTPVQPALRDAVRRAAALLEADGIPAEPLDFSLIDGSFELWRFIFVDFITPFNREMVAGKEDLCSWTGLELIHLIKDNPLPTAAELAATLVNRDRMRARLLTELGTSTVVLAPAFGVTAFPHRARRHPVPEGEIDLFDCIKLVAPWNLLGMPSMVVPITFDAGGLPAGIQLIGPPYSEEILLDLAVRLEQLRGPFPSPPGYSD